jgi:F-type H+-transporting ATPase subunit delta
MAAVARRYAEALADVTTKAGAALGPQQAAEELRSFASTLEEARELREALSTPAVPLARKKAVIGRVADELKLALLTKNFLFVLVDHRRLAALGEIIQAFEVAADERLGFARAEVAAAREMSGAQSAALGAALERLTGKKVRMRVKVDEGLVGGAVAQIGSTIYDGSVRGQLAALERRLGGKN